MNKKNIKKNRRTIFEVEGKVTANKSKAYASRSIIEENRALILKNYTAAFMGNRQLANLSQIASTAILRGFGREAELEADRVGAEYIAKVGYDPDALKNVIGVLKNQEEFDKVLAEEENREPYAYHGVFATHPDNDKRLQEVIKAAKKSVSEVKLDENKQTWVNTVLQFTHGYGLTMSPVNSFDSQGKPYFFSKDIPSDGVINVKSMDGEIQENLSVENPRIYYGESSCPYVIVNTNKK